MRVAQTSRTSTLVVARVASTAVQSTKSVRPSLAVTVVPGAQAAHSLNVGQAIHAYHGESGFAHVDAPGEVIASLAAVRGYAAQLASFAHDSERVGRLLDIVG